MKKLLLLAILSVAANSFAVINREPLQGQELENHTREQNRLKELRHQRDANGNPKVKVTKMDGIHKRYNKVTAPAQ